jgi:hypothetical protein
MRRQKNNVNRDKPELTVNALTCGEAPHREALALEVSKVAAQAQEPAMATPFTLTPQPIRVTAAIKQPIFLAVDISDYDACDLEAVYQIEGTATNAALNLITGMQTDTDDGWITTSSNFTSISGTGQQVARVSVSSGLLQFLRWDVSSLGGASALTFFIRGIARNGVGTGGGTLASAYAAGSSQGDETIVLDATRLGVRIRDNAAPIGGGNALLAVQDNAGSVNYLYVSTANVTIGAKLLPFSDNALDLGAAGGRFAHVYTTEVDSGGTNDLLLQTNNFDRLLLGRTTSNVLTSGVADGATAVGNVLDTFQAFGNAGSKLLSIRTAGTEHFFFRWDGTVASIVSPNIMKLVDNNDSGVQANNDNFMYLRAAGSALVKVGGAAMVPMSDLACTLGGSSARWTELWARRYAGVEQTIAAASSITVNPASGEYVRITLGATAITTVNAGSGYAGEIMTTAIIQDGTGSRSISGWSASFVFAGGSYTPTATANKRDLLTWRWDATASKWYEQSRAMNL